MFRNLQMRLTRLKNKDPKSVTHAVSGTGLCYIHLAQLSDESGRALWPIYHHTTYVKRVSPHEISVLQILNMPATLCGHHQATDGQDSVQCIL